MECKARGGHRTATSAKCWELPHFHLHPINDPRCVIADCRRQWRAEHNSGSRCPELQEFEVALLQRRWWVRCAELHEANNERVITREFRLTAPFHTLEVIVLMIEDNVHCTVSSNVAAVQWDLLVYGRDHHNDANVIQATGQVEDCVVQVCSSRCFGEFRMEGKVRRLLHDGGISSSAH